MKKYGRIIVWCYKATASFARASTHPPVHASMHAPAHPPVHASMQASTHPPVHASIHALRASTQSLPFTPPRTPPLMPLSLMCRLTPSRPRPSGERKDRLLHSTLLNYNTIARLPFIRPFTRPFTPRTGICPQDQGPRARERPAAAAAHAHAHTAGACLRRCVAGWEGRQ